MELIQPFGGTSSHFDIVESSGADRDRTDDLFVANESLSQLSYSPRSNVFVLIDIRGISFSSTTKFLSSEPNILATHPAVDHSKLSNNIAKNGSEFKIKSLMNLLLRELRKCIREHRIRHHLQSSAISGIMRGFPSIIRRILKPGGDGDEYEKESRPSPFFDNFQNLCNLRLALQILRHMLQDFTRVVDPAYPAKKASP